MKFWIARESCGLWLFDSKPIKRNRNNDKYYIWNNNRYSIDHKLFPEITFENSPKEIELKLKRELSFKEMERLIDDLI